MPINDLLQAAIDKVPTDFADQFNTIIGERISAALEDKKIEFAQAVYGDEDEGEDADVEPLDDTDENEDEDLDIDLDDLDLDLDDLDLDGDTDDED